jgi:hypothetical protein
LESLGLAAQPQIDPVRRTRDWAALDGIVSPELEIDEERNSSNALLKGEQTTVETDFCLA